MPELKELPERIYELFNPEEDHVPDEENLDVFCNNLKEAMRGRLAKQSDRSDRPIRFSSLGRNDRQVWYDAHPDGTEEKLDGKQYVKYLYGAILEELLVFLCREAGYPVDDTQKEVATDGIKGSIDGIVNGTVVDFKSASPYGYQKFKQGTVPADDPFGYVAQLAGYAAVLTPGKDAAWIAIDKVSGDICVSPLPYTVMKHYQPEPRIEELKNVVTMEEPPERCHSDVEDGKSGNRRLGTACSYCSHKSRCWPSLRGFAYSNGPRYLTKVERLPDVPEFNI